MKLTLLVLLSLTSCVSPGFHQRRIQEIENNCRSRDGHVLGEKLSEAEEYRRFMEHRIAENAVIGEPKK